MLELENDLSNKKSKTTSSLIGTLHNLFSVASIQTDHCSKGHLITKPSSSYIVDVACEDKSFMKSLENSLNSSKNNKLWCDQCKENGLGENEKAILSLPQYLILVINQPSLSESECDPVLILFIIHCRFGDNMSSISHHLSLSIWIKIMHQKFVLLKYLNKV